MKLDVIIGNPPYQRYTGSGALMGGTSIYEDFIQASIRKGTKYIVMITKSSWFTGFNYKDFRKTFLKGNHIKSIVDYTNYSDVFEGKVGIAGGISYFLWDADYNGKCHFKNKNRQIESETYTDLNKHDIIIRYSEMLGVIDKIKRSTKSSLSDSVLGVMAFGFETKLDNISRVPSDKNNIVLVGSHNRKGYVSLEDVKNNREKVDEYKLLVSQSMGEYSCLSDENGRYNVISNPFIVGPGIVCTHSYLVVGCHTDRNIINNMCTYLKTKFVRALMLVTLTSKSISRSAFAFVPYEDFSRAWNDEELYKKYGLTEREQVYRELDKTIIEQKSRKDKSCSFILCIQYYSKVNRYIYILK